MLHKYVRFIYLLKENFRTLMFSYTTYILYSAAPTFIAPRVIYGAHLLVLFKDERHITLQEMICEDLFGSVLSDLAKQQTRNTQYNVGGEVISDQEGNYTSTC